MKIKHTRSTIVGGTIALTIATLLAPAQTVNAAGDTELAIGRTEYMVTCASCHGGDGKGGGPVGSELTKKPFDLTKIMASNNGQFPFFRVYDVIAGTEDIRAHGGREMPVWGSRFRHDATQLLSLGPLYPGENAEEMIQGRILRLVYYLRSIQQN